ncbi:epsin, putative [Leishmania tarentolae]|uniref:Epsin, putative n=1 Tax=Leishmania tarentolae TaxID=5689 RepID=A0A640KNA7_LEITA|nr:epsin, putative [Leishmania tarentolae]
MNFTQQLWSVKEWGRVMATGSQYVTIVHEATNDEKWGPTGSQMDAVCNAYPRGGPEIMNELRSRLKNRDKSWRPCYKSLLVIDYLARNVGERYLPEICALVPLIRTISTSFYYTNPKGVDHGVSVRERAKKLADLLSDGLQLREERAVAAQIKEKLSRNASDGGGPNTGNLYTGAGGYDGFYSGGQGGSHDRDRYRNSDRGSRQSYDSYRTLPSPATTMSRPRTKEEQEQYDMEMALRLQRDEERRSGVSAEQLEEMYAKKLRQRRNEAERQKATAEDDERLAMRLQQEEEERARREGVSLPTLSSDKPSNTPAKVPSPKPPAANALEELFAPPVVSQPAAAAPASSADPFDTFLNAHPGLAPQQNTWGNPSQQLTSAQQNQWAHPQTANAAWGAPQQLPQQPIAAPQPQQSTPWGQSATVPTSNSWGQPQPQQASCWNPPQQGSSQQQLTGNSNSAGSWGQAPSPQPRDPWSQPQQPPELQQPPQPQQPSNAWGQFEQKPQPGAWGQTSAPAQQLYESWSQPSAANTAKAGDSTISGGNLDNMWGALDQFSNQQHHK